MECEYFSEQDLEIETEVPVDNVQDTSKYIVCLENAPNLEFLPFKMLPRMCTVWSKVQIILNVHTVEYL